MALTQADIKVFQQELRNRRDELGILKAASTDARKTVDLDQQSQGRLSRIDAMGQQAMAQAQQRQRDQHLMRIEQALKRIESGDFGFCGDCEEQIARKRLDIDPSAPLCIKCAARS
ncbi:hypothetical protein MNBD_ALPHA12-1867 [hydrothermal vent metagenome]|uniref:Zinc finger DksA/TraR C4-type domain-containing protein n=1 Tax=hydrothermal vent metagenome TaxID=652676 RepID=A0A3B0TU18_9ZZZZ